MKYVNVTIDNKSHLTDDLYTYRCAFDEVRPGSRVRVAFGRGKALKDAYVFDVMDELPAPVKGLKDVAELTEDAPLGEESMELARWMHSRYLCRYMDAVKLLLPPGKPSARGKRRDPLAKISAEPQVIDALPGIYRNRACILFPSLGACAVLRGPAHDGAGSGFVNLVSGHYFTFQ